MKKLTTIACVFLALALFVGIERFNGPDPSESEVSGAPVSEVSNQRSIRKATATMNPDATLDPPIPIPIASKPSVEIEVEADSVELANLKSSHAAARGSISGIHFIRSRAILGTEQPGAEAIARINKAIKHVVSASSNSAVWVFDQDGLTASQSPFLVYASPRLDLTEAVKIQYLILVKSDLMEHPPKDVGQRAAPE